jgi:hypothetical protein
MRAEFVNTPVGDDLSEMAVKQTGFTPEDILWAVGIWSVILCLSPVIVFYTLMVA